MFKNIVNLSVKNNFFEALIFYIIWSIVLSIFLFIAGFTISFIGVENDKIIKEILKGISAFFVFCLAYTIYKKRGLTSKMDNHLVVFSGLLSFYPGFLIGLIALAYLSTRENKKLIEEKQEFKI